jgi:EAL domain-containing protein (putative c-di-GMP-specific phosphodiesterase class I)/sensor domain CHASE-containing protein
MLGLEMLLTKAAMLKKAMLIFLALAPICAYPAGTPVASDSAVDTRPATRALEGLRRAWTGEIADLTAMVATLAVADDTYEFIARPNIPYIEDHYDVDRLSDERINTILIVNLKGKPLFWRRVNLGINRGFVDAEAFFAQLPALTPAGDPGVPSLAGAMQLAQGPSLIVAMPIFSKTGSGAARGWLIAVRALNAMQWRRYEERASVEAEVLEAPATPSPDIEAAMQAPLEPVVRMAGSRIHGLMAVPDVSGKPLRLFSVMLDAPPIALKPPTPVVAQVNHRWPWFAMAAIFVCITGVTGVAASRRRARPRVARVPQAEPPASDKLAKPPMPLKLAPIAPASAPSVPAALPALGALIAPAAPAAPVAPAASAVPALDKSAAPPPAAAAPVAATPALQSGAAVAHVVANTAAARWEELQGRIKELNPVCCFQPQIDLQTGRVAGVEALLAGMATGDRQATLDFIAQVEAAGLGFALAQRWIQDACRNQRNWLRQIEHEFPIGVPISQRALEEPDFLPFVRRTLAEFELPPQYLELQISETVLGGSASALRALTAVQSAGICLAIDGYNAARSNLRLLTKVRITKLRIDPTLVRRIAVSGEEAMLFDGIVGAARGLGVAVCATGVDSPDLVSAAMRHGRPLAQGDALGPCIDAEQFLVLLRGSASETWNLPPIQVDDVLSEKFGAAESGS